MKSIKFFFFATALFSFALTSCQNDKDAEATPETQALTVDEAAENMQTIMVASVEEAEAAAEMTEEKYTGTEGQIEFECGAEVDTVFEASQSNGPIIATYMSDWKITLICDENDIPMNLLINTDAASTYEGPLVSGEGNGLGQYTLSGLLPIAENYEMMGTVSYSGTATSKKGRKETFNLETIIDFSDVIISKDPRYVLSGTATMTLIATAPNAGPATFTGSIVFNGDGTATLIINGNEYTFDLP